MSSAILAEQKIELFYSYSHKDEDLRKELEKHLSILKILGIIENWNFQMIGAGKEWEEEISSHLNSAHIILLLISPDFLASDYCNNVEVKRAMQRHENGEARVIPVILRPVIWERMPFSKLQALPEKGKSITKWQNRDEAFKNVAEGIIQVVDEFKLRQTYSLEEINKTGKASKIIILQDDVMWLNRVKNLLKDQNFLIETYDHYSEKLLHRLSKNDYDLLITDIALKNTEYSKDVALLVKFVRVCHENKPIILVTGYKYDDLLEVIDDLTKSKIDGFISKNNWNPEDFLKLVTKALTIKKADRLL